MKWIYRLLILAFLPVVALGTAQAAGNITKDIAAARKSTTTGLICDPASLLPGCKESADQVLNTLKSIVTKPMQDLVNFISNGLQDAADLSIAIPDLQDGNGYACWSQMKAAGEVFKKHPIPVTLSVASDLEAVRLIHMTATKVCNNAACTQVFNEATNVISSTAPLKTPIPSMTQLCAQIPPIAIVAPPTGTPAPADAAKPDLGVFTPTPIPAPTVTPATPSPADAPK